MPKKHVLTNVQDKPQFADCSNCGPCRYGKSDWGPHCVGARDVTKERVLHRLTNVDPETRLADCSQCGPNTPVSRAAAFGSKKGPPWQCKSVYDKNTDNHDRADSRYEHPLKSTREQMLREHGPLCDICGEIPNDKGHEGRLQYDHDHKTGKFRGWICGRHNKMLGLSGDDANLLDAAASYLRNAENRSKM